MSITDLYHELIEGLEAEGAAAVVSTYRQGGGFEKRVVSPADASGWHALAGLRGHPQARTSGPVTSLDAEDGSLTLIEHYTTKPRIIILGAGHIAAALAPLARITEFEVVVYDDRPSFANRQRFPEADTVICDGFTQLFKRLHVRETDYVVVVTRGHKHDQDCLAGILAGPEPAYTGMIGSRRRVAIVMDQLRKKGFDGERIGRIHSPIGLKIGAVTPGEIAISIMAELISVKRLERGEGELASCERGIAETLAARGDDFDALITIRTSTGSVPIETGAKLAMTYAGELSGTIGGGCSEADAMQVAREVVNTGGWRTHTIDMSDAAEDDGMVCGGTLDVVIEAPCVARWDGVAAHCHPEPAEGSSTAPAVDCGQEAPRPAVGCFAAEDSSRSAD
ncbi:MAG: XdhC family protein [Coriobacteriales bacterium]|jgi:xanthine dehydrogenase accessory factor|nr:XdhC family protein [Coriobacteriales bacterium]